MAFTTVQHPQSSTTIFLDQPPSCLQFCPASPNYFVVGTYLLSETKSDDSDVQQTKTGSLQLYKLNPDSNELTQIQRLPLPYAVFDLHFHPTDPTVLAIATSAGSIALFTVSHANPTSPDPVVTHVWTRSVHEDPSVPALFLAWAPENWFPNSSSGTDGFAVTFSDGRTGVFGATRTTGEGFVVERESDVAGLGTFQSSQVIEVWFVAMAVFRQSSQHGREEEEEEAPVPYLLTGDDFGSVHTRQFAVSSSLDDDLLPSLLLDHDDRARHHTAGVTAILPLPLPLVDGAPVILTGCYDEYLRVYHATRRGGVLAEACLGGGVWRLQFLSEERTAEGGWRFVVLASCMHAGTRVVRVTRRRSQEERDQGLGEWAIDVLAEFTEHESMNYASDFWKGDTGSPDADDGKEVLCVSSSFYDRRVCVWRVKM